MTEAFWIEFVRQVPLMVTAATAGYGVWVGKKNGRKADAIHAATAETLANTNGHLTDLSDELAKARAERARTQAFNESLQQTVTTLSTILAAQRVAPVATSGTVGTTDAAPVNLRKGDVAPTLPNPPLPEAPETP